MRWNLLSFAFVSKPFLILDLLNFAPATWCGLSSTPHPCLEKFSDCLEGIFLVAGIPGSHVAGRAVYAGGGTSASCRCWSPAAATLDTEADRKTSPNSASVFSYTGDRQRRAADAHHGVVRASCAVCSVSSNICQPSLKNPLEISQLGRNDDNHHKWKMKTLSRRFDLPYATSELFWALISD